MKEYPENDDELCPSCRRSIEEFREIPKPSTPKPITEGFTLINGIRFYPPCPCP